MKIKDEGDKDDAGRCHNDSLSSQPTTRAARFAILIDSFLNRDVGFAVYGLGVIVLLTVKNRNKSNVEIRHRNFKNTVVKC